MPKLFISDNFSTFRSEDERLLNFLRYNNIDWKYILPLSPWWGGFYERLIPLELLRENCEKNERYVVDIDTTVGKQEVVKSKSTRPRRNAAATGELIRRLMNDD